MIQNDLFKNKKELSQFVNREVFGILKKYHYKKNIGNFYLEKKYFSTLIDIQKSRYTSNDEEDFTLNWSIVFPMSAYFYEYVPQKKPSFSRSLIGGRVAALMEPRSLDRWWKLFTHSDKDEVDKVLKEIEYYLTEYAIPFLEKLNTINDVIAMLESTKTKDGFYGFYPTHHNPDPFEAILYLFNGNKEQSLAIMDKIIADSKSNLYRESMGRLKIKIQNFDILRYKDHIQ